MKSIKSIIKEELNNLQSNDSIIDQLYKRVPFFKEYNVISLNDKDTKIGNPIRPESGIIENLQLDRHGTIANRKFMIQNEPIVFPSFSYRSDILSR